MRNVTLVRELQNVVGIDRVLADPLRTPRLRQRCRYQARRSRCRGAPGHRRGGRCGGEDRRSPRDPDCAAWSRDGFGRRYGPRQPLARRVNDPHDRDQRRRRESHGLGGGRRVQPRPEHPNRIRRAALRSGSVVPGGLHYRGQRGQQQRRAALSGRRHDRQPRAGG